MASSNSSDLSDTDDLLDVNDPFFIPSAILADLVMKGGRPARTEKTSAFEALPLEIHTAIIGELKHVDTVALALTSKTMAAIVLAEPKFKEIAEAEEMAHLELRHEVYRNFLYDRLIFCPIFPCPLHARQIWVWRIRVRSQARARRAEQEMQLAAVERLAIAEKERKKITGATD